MAPEDRSGESEARPAPEPEGESAEIEKARALQDFLEKRDQGEPFERDALLKGHPGVAPELGEVLRTVDQFSSLVAPSRAPQRLGDFRIVREVGRGGMGIVYEAWQETLERRVALKVLPAALLADARAVNRFQREARVVARLHHENIVEVYSMGIENDVPHFAMEFVEGDTLDDLRRAGVRPFADGRLLAESFAGVADALAHAHALGIVHRDLKPSNLIVDRQGRLRILDFGLACVEGQDRLTGSRERLGTPLYMSPEQAHPGREEFGPATDIYGLGVTLYEVLAGRPPFRGKTDHHTLHQIATRDPPSPRRFRPDVPRDLETIVLKCLRKEPRDRYADAARLGADLRRFARGEAVEARPQPVWERCLRLAARHRLRVAAGLIVVALLCVVAGLGFIYRRQALVLREREYGERLNRAVVKMLQGHLAGRRLPGRPGAGRYSDGLFIPPEGFREPGDFEAVVGRTGRHPVREALEEIEAAKRLLPGRPETCYYQARAQLLQGLEQEALEELGRALDRDASFAPALVLHAAILESRGRIEEARSEMERAAASGGEGWAQTWLMVHRAVMKGDWSGALAAYGKLLEGEGAEESYPGSSLETRLGSGTARLELGDREGAADDFARAAGRWSQLLEPDLLLAKAYLLDGREKQARAVLVALFARTPARDDAAVAIAELYASVGDLKEGRHWVDQVEAGPLRNRGLAPILIRLGNWKEAREAAARAASLDPSDVLAHIWLGLALLAGQEGAAAAIEPLVRARTLDPRHPMARVWLGDALAKQGELDDALVEYREATRIDPRNAWALISMGVTLERKERKNEAFGAFLRAFELDPGLGACYSHLETILRAEGDPIARAELDRLVGAIEAVLAAGETHPRLPELLRVLCLTLVQGATAGDLERALRYGGLAVEKTERAHPQMLAALARVHAALGRLREAVSLLEEAAALPHLKRRDLEHLAALRRRLHPALVSCPSIEAALAELDLEPLLGDDAPWRFLRGTQEPSEGLRWTETGFLAGSGADSWGEGRAGFGFADGDDRTVLEGMKGSYTTVYLRGEFQAPEPSRYRSLLLSVRVDDGFVAWLNGTEVARVGIRSQEPRLACRETASVSVTDEPPLPGELRLEPRLLSPGRNVLAVQGFNSALNSSDFSLHPVLLGETGPVPERDRRLLEAFRGAMAKQVEWDPGGGLDAYLEGRVLMRAGRFAPAAARLREARERFPSRPEPVLHLVDCLLELGTPGEAECELRRALEGPLAGEAGLWRRWFRLLAIDRKMSPAEAIAALPGGPPWVEVEGEAPAPPSPARDIGWALKQALSGSAIRINCGGDGHRSVKGAFWSRDRFFLSGNRFSEWQWERPSAIRQRAPRFVGEIAGTEDDVLYQTERWFPTDEAGEVGYSVPLYPGRYRVTLGFAEVFHSKPGSRAFDIVLEGRKVAHWHEPLQAGFATAAERTFTVAVDDGFLEVRFFGQAAFPKVSSLEIEAAH